jgi:tetratricopeptide (TPR) repeat protein
MSNKNYKQALEDYLKSVELNPGNLDVLYNIGVAYDSSDDINEAC